jgi:NADPH-dependent glutamate synthase beta subunit-like oxidoreductase
MSEISLGTYYTSPRSSKIPALIHVEKCWPEVNRYAPCEAACPLHMDVPNYVMAIAQRKFDKALEIMRESNPLVSICGRVCHHPCETECNRTVVDNAIAIEWLKRYAADWGKASKPNPVQKTKKDKIAIVGAGPAGLTAAHDLVKKGYVMSIYDAAPKAGGILTSAIPEFILPRAAVESDIAYIQALGVRIHSNIRIGKDISLDELRNKGYRAILIAIGAQQSGKLGFPGSDLGGVDYALPFLESVKNGNVTRINGAVWVIGGGAVAMDVARSAVRLGAKEVHVACLENRDDMPAFKWEITAAEREGVHLHSSLASQEFVSQNGRKVNGIRFQRVNSTSRDIDGGFHWTLQTGLGSDFAVMADHVIIAIGQRPDVGFLKNESLGTKAGRLSINQSTGQTIIPGLFAAGDVSAIGGTVTEAIAAGRRAARSIEQYLNGQTIIANDEKKEIVTIKAEDVPAFFPRKSRWDMPHLQPKEAVRTYHEVDLGYTKWQAVEEAKRCLNCRMCAECIFKRGQLCFDTANRLL